MPRILFVCVANSCRSQMAEAVAKSLVDDRWEVWSAGSRPSGQVDPVVRILMEEIGLDISDHHSKGLDAIPKQRWDYVVTMGCGDACPHVASEQRIDWDLPDPVGLPIEEARRIRDQIIDRLRKLLNAAA